jgi:hypothetical protein
MYKFIPQADASKVNGYVVVLHSNTNSVVYEVERKYWDIHVKRMFADLSQSNINCPIIPLDVYLDPNGTQNDPKTRLVGYFAILET